MPPEVLVWGRDIRSGPPFTVFIGSLFKTFRSPWKKPFSALLRPIGQGSTH